MLSSSKWFVPFKVFFHLTCTNSFPYAYYMLYPSNSPRSLHPSDDETRTNHEVLQYVIFAILFLPHILLSTCSQTSSIYLLSSEWETKFHTHTNSSHVVLCQFVTYIAVIWFLRAILDGRNWLFTLSSTAPKKCKRILNFWLEKWISVNCCKIGRVEQWLHTKLVTELNKSFRYWQECVSCDMNFIYKMSNLWRILSDLVCVWNVIGLFVCKQCLFYFLILFSNGLWVSFLYHVCLTACLLWPYFWYGTPVCIEF
jgi:hypothetical protein